MIDIDELERLAKATKISTWKWWTSNSKNRLTSMGGFDGDVISAYRASDGVPSVNCSQTNRSYIEAANPAAILELIERLRNAEIIYGIHCGFDK